MIVQDRIGGCESEIYRLVRRNRWFPKRNGTFQRGVYELDEFKRKEGIGIISDSDLLIVAEHMKAITEILEKYKEKIG